MAKSFYLSLLLGIIGISCKPDYVTVGKKLEGSWHLERFQYTDTNNQLLVIDAPPKIILNFTDSKRNGTLSVSSASYPFEYNFGPDQCNIDVKDETTLPLEAIGKVQVYSYAFIDKKNIKFTIDKEYHYTAKKVIRNVQYTFSKK
ncbi:hypothetical protein [Runella slithyformis]|uniref:Lipocalin-like domain-containing protein n=1 Tax=Runella slithyformis (strain ATCC 29530 / DSM 19594 / LMG 11500 / NCIMB 11436 / LSU 4) TaxID=761193 RepID=A0A7U3ZMJ9_RUNSL|nr:hypothetical protein [Runella slithyformis]AEI49969.1 hypothetical protein Runsl_3610 [Runella slithyformis DSM 19594]